MHLDDLVADVRRLSAGVGGRFLLGVAGAPGSGKSTLAAALAGAMSEAQILPMDGFHLDDSILNARGHRPRKGAPHTFDVGGFVSILARARTEAALYAPKFDRDLEISRGGAIFIGPQTRILVVEGNYLLHDREGWEDVRPQLDACWFLDVPMPELESRLTARWDGYGMTPAQIRDKLEGNDLPNARLVAGTATRADRILDTVDLGQSRTT